jgi:hypothetical protein
MAANNKKDKLVKSNSPQPGPVIDKDDPLREESTDFRAPGEKFETLPPGENLDLGRMDQPRTNLESRPKAHKEKDSVHTRKGQNAVRGKDKKSKKSA